MKNDPMGDRFKRYEEVTRQTLPRRTFTVIRVDGRAFHSLLKGAERPFDLEVMRAMDQVGLALCREISGAVLAFVQSDEVSVLVQDFGSLEQQPWFGGVVAKQVSVSASVATMAFNRRFSREKWGLFDSRVFTVPDPVEVANYFVWRQRDATRNSIAMTAQTWFSPRKLQGVGQQEMKALLQAEHNIDWEDCPEGFKYGRVVTRNPTTTYADASAQWLILNAPVFKAEPGNWLAEQVPVVGGFQ